MFNLRFKKGESRALDTYGYTRVTLTVTQPNGLNPPIREKYNACGGNYDLWGAVLSDWIQNQFQTELREYLNNVQTKDVSGALWRAVFLSGDQRSVFVDGAVGERTMLELLENLGYWYTIIKDKNNHRIGYTVGKN